MQGEAQMGNIVVDRADDKLSVVRLLHMAVVLWLGCLLLFFVIDSLFVKKDSPTPWYYGVNALSALLIWGLALWPQAQSRLGRAFLPLVIGLMSVVPILTNHFLIPHSPPAPVSSVPGSPPPPELITSAEIAALRLVPVLFMALVLTAWQYRWPQVVLFSLGTGVLTLGLMLFSSGEEGTTWELLFLSLSSSRVFPRPLFIGLLAAVIQAVGFLVIGYFITSLIGRLRAQQAALNQANAQLLQHASTLESLTVSRERNRMARELHDTLAHTLSGLSVQLETVQAYWNVEPQTAYRLLDKALEATREGLHETRRVLKALRASPLDDLGLSLAIQRMAESAVARANVQLDLAIPEQVPPLPPDVEQCIYRVAQEAVANVVRHANAHVLALQLACQDGETRLLVRDDGVGFDVPHAQQNGHYGLSGLRERAQLVGGQLTIASQLGLGTTVHLVVKGQMLSVSG
jgi:signal transduction histidine kinase